MPSPCIVLRYDTIWCAEYDTTMLNHDLPNVANRCHPPLYSFQYLKCHPISFFPDVISSITVFFVYVFVFVQVTGKCICNWVCFCILCPVTVLRRLWCWRTGIQGLDCFPCTFWGMNGSSIIVGYCEVKPRLVWIFRPGPGLIQYCTFRLQHGYEGYVFSRLQGKNILLNMPEQTHYVFYTEARPQIWERRFQNLKKAILSVAWFRLRLVLMDL